MLIVNCDDDFEMCCTDLHAIATHLLDQVWRNLEPCYADFGCAPLERYVTAGNGDDGIPDKLNVGINSVGTSPASIVANRTLPIPAVRAEFVVRLHESGWPTVRAEGSTILAPAPAEQAKAIRQSLGHAEMMYRTLLALHSTRQLIPAGVRGCGNALLGQLFPVPPRGGVIGWTATVTVDVLWGGG